MRSLILAVAAATGIAGSAAAAEPADTVRAVMMLELWSVATADIGEDQPFSPPALAAYFTPAFAAAYEAVVARQTALDEPLIDGDPIANSQDFCPFANLAIAPASTADGRAAVTATFQSQWCYPEADPEVTQAVTAVVFRLVADGANWRIDDFDVDGASFRAVLTQLLKE